MRNGNYWYVKAAFKLYKNTVTSIEIYGYYSDIRYNVTDKNGIIVADMSAKNSSSNMKISNNLDKMK